MFSLSECPTEEETEGIIELEYLEVMPSSSF